MAGKTYGYVRVSTKGQNEDRQLIAMREFGIPNEQILVEKQVAIVVLDMPLLDTREGQDLTGTLIADIVLQLLSYVAQTERENIRQRQAGKELGISRTTFKHRAEAWYLAEGMGTRAV